MDINFDCTHCGKPLVASTSDIGYDVRCPACNTTVSLKPAARERVVVEQPLPSESVEQQKSALFGSVQAPDLQGVENKSEITNDEAAQAPGSGRALRDYPSYQALQSLNGIGGWLLFFIITLVVISPLRNVYQLTSLYYDASAAFGVVYLLEFAIITYIASFVFLTLYQCTAAYKLARKKPSAVQYAKRMLLVTTLIASIANTLIFFFLVTLPYSDEANNSALLVEQIKTILSNCLYAFVWNRYLNKSVRVRNTFPDSWVDNAR